MNSDTSSSKLSPKQQSNATEQAINQALQHFAAGRLGEADRICQLILQSAPNNPVALHIRGVIAHHLGKNDKAVEFITRALTIKPDYGEAHYNLGITYQALGRLNDAVASYQKTLDIKPDFPDAHNNLGIALRDLGRLGEAVTSYRKAISFNPEYADAHNNLGIALMDVGELDQAIMSFQKALNITPKLTDAWNNLKIAAKALGFLHVNGGAADAGNVIRFNDSARATVNYSIYQYYQARFRPHEADASFERIIAKLPQIRDQTLPINGLKRAEQGRDQLTHDMVALIAYGRSGTGLLHSLIDNHPEISTLPSIYLRGYFNEGIWDKLTNDGWRGLPQRFANEFAVLFDARTPKPTPSRVSESPFMLGTKEGMTCVGENRDEHLSLNRQAFCTSALKMMEGMESIDPMSFLGIVHAAFEMEVGTQKDLSEKPRRNKHLCFYHIHNPDDYAKPNFLRYAPDVRLLIMVREPIQNCESSLRAGFNDNNYSRCVHNLLEVLFSID